jgi:hypothetical protein
MRKIIFLFFVFPFICLAQVQYGQTLFGTIVNENNGRALAYSADNNRLVIADGKNGSGNIIGQAKVFELVEGTWTQIGQTLFHEAVGPLNSVTAAISNDGNRIAVASMGNSPTVLESGSLKVFEYINNTWTQIGQEILPLTIGEQFAYRIAFSNDGTTIAAGAHRYDNSQTNIGYVRVFSFENNTWEDKGSLIEGSNSNSQFGYDLSLSLNGNILAVKGNGETSEDGFVKFYEYINNDWSEINTINTVSNYAYRIELTPDAQTIVIANPFYYDGTLQPGQVQVFTKINDNWLQKGSNINGLEAGDYFGLEISISDDGNILVIGAPRYDFDGLEMGYINLYKYQNDDWVLFGDQIRGFNDNDYVGNNFSLSPDGSRLAIGFVYDDTNATNSGKVITYDLASALSINEFQNTSFQLFPNPTKNQFTIQLNTTSILEKVTIYNTLGQQVLTTENPIVDTSKLASGSYIVEVLTTKGKASKQLIIE